VIRPNALAPGAPQRHTRVEVAQAVSIMFGPTVAALSLLVTPVLYAIFFDAHEKGSAVGAEVVAVEKSQQ
jgi:hypothetical protein